MSYLRRQLERVLSSSKIPLNLIHRPKRQDHNIGSFSIMISDTTLSILAKILSIGNKCYMIPFKWDSERNELLLTPTLGHRMFPYFAILYYCSIICFTSYRYTVTSLTDSMYIVFNLTATGTGNLLLGLICMKHDQIISTINAAFKLNTLHCK